jgi:hypothetical protein
MHVARSCGIVFFVFKHHNPEQPALGTTAFHRHVAVATPLNRSAEERQLLRGAIKAAHTV